MNLDEAIARLAALQYGLVNRAQARALGTSEAHFRTRLESGRWERMHRDVFRVAGVPASFRQAAMAAVLATDEGGAVSHGAAASLWGLSALASSALEVVVLRPRHPRLDGVVVHQTGRLTPADLGSVDGIRVTSPARTLVDLASRVSRWRLGLGVDEALTRRLTTIAELCETADRICGRGRTGSPRVRSVLAERDERQAVPESVLESRFLDLLRRAGLPLPVCQHPVEHEGRIVASIDFAYPQLRVGIEADGWAAHGGREAFESDRRRANVLAGLGWVLVRVTWRQVTRQPDEVVRAVRAALAAAAGRHRAEPAPETAA